MKNFYQDQPFLSILYEYLQNGKIVSGSNVLNIPSVTVGHQVRIPQFFFCRTRAYEKRFGNETTFRVRTLALLLIAKAVWSP